MLLHPNPPLLCANQRHHSVTPRLSLGRVARLCRHAVRDTDRAASPSLVAARRGWQSQTAETVPSARSRSLRRARRRSTRGLEDRGRVWSTGPWKMRGLKSRSGLRSRPRLPQHHHALRHDSCGAKRVGDNEDSECVGSLVGCVREDVGWAWEDGAVHAVMACGVAVGLLEQDGETLSVL